VSTGAGTSPSTRHRGRHRAREAAVQMLYQWEVGRSAVEDVVQTFWSLDVPGAQPAPDAVRVFAEELVRGTIADLDRIDPLIARTAEHWRLSRMAALDRLILRLATYEFLREGTPRNVVINEALELAKTFSTEESARFINGILDAIKQQLDEGEGGGRESGSTRN
jgi:transcription antitermination protein NusB